MTRTDLMNMLATLDLDADGIRCIASDLDADERDPEYRAKVARTVAESLSRSALALQEFANGGAVVA